MKNKKVQFIKYLIAGLSLFCLLDITFLMYVSFSTSVFFRMLFVLMFMSALYSIVFARYFLPIFLRYCDYTVKKRKSDLSFEPSVEGLAKHVVSEKLNSKN